MLFRLNRKSSVIDDSCTLYVGGFLIKLFLEKMTHNCVCSDFLKDKSEKVTAPHQYFLMLKAYHVPGKLFRNLVAPSQAAFDFIKQLESHFLAVLESVAHVPNVCAVLVATLSSVRFFRFRSEECQKSFLKMFCQVLLCWHVRFVSRNQDKVCF